MMQRVGFLTLVTLVSCSAQFQKEPAYFATTGGNRDYPVVLTSRQPFNFDSNTIAYRPEPLVAPYVRRPPPQLPPIPTTFSSSRPPFVKPYVTRPYQPVRSPSVVYTNHGGGGILPNEFGHAGQFYKSSEFEPQLVSEIAFPDSIATPYAPGYKTYIPSLYFRHDIHGLGAYTVQYETANGISHKESGFTKKVGSYNPSTGGFEEKSVPVKTGQVSWRSPEGIRFSFGFVADENGKIVLCYTFPKNQTEMAGKKAF